MLETLQSNDVLLCVEALEKKCRIGLADTVTYKGNKPTKWFVTDRDGSVTTKSNISIESLTKRFIKISSHQQTPFTAIVRKRDGILSIYSNVGWQEYSTYMMHTMSNDEILSVHAFIKSDTNTFYRNKFNNSKNGVTQSTFTYPLDINNKAAVSVIDTDALEYTPCLNASICDVMNAASAKIVSYIEESLNAELISINFDYVIDTQSQVWLLWSSDALYFPIELKSIVTFLPRVPSTPLPSGRMVTFNSNLPVECINSSSASSSSAAAAAAIIAFNEDTNRQISVMDNTKLGSEFILPLVPLTTDTSNSNMQLLALSRKKTRESTSTSQDNRLVLRLTHNTHMKNGVVSKRSLASPPLSSLNASVVATKSTTPTNTRGTILLGCNDDVLMKRLAALAQNAEYIVITARNGSSVIRRFMDNDVDCVIIDKNLRAIDSFEILKAIRRYEGKKLHSAVQGNLEAKSSIVCVSDTVDEEDLRCYTSAGFNGCIVKNIEDHTFIQFLHALLSPLN